MTLITTNPMLCLYKSSEGLPPALWHTVPYLCLHHKRFTMKSLVHFLLFQYTDVSFLQHLCNWYHLKLIFHFRNLHLELIFVVSGFASMVFRSLWRRVPGTSPGTSHLPLFLLAAWTAVHRQAHVSSSQRQWPHTHTRVESKCYEIYVTISFVINKWR